MKTRTLAFASIVAIGSAVLTSGGCGDNATASGGGGATGSGGSGGGATCGLEATSICEGNVAVACPIQSGNQGRTDCSKSGQTCADGLGCVTCVPGGGTCANNQAKTCKADGSGFVEFTCDPVQGMKCGPGGCTGTCSPGELGPSYIGCDYWPTVTLNPVWKGFDFAVAIANATDKAAKVTVSQGAQAIETETIAAGDLKIVKLPWVKALKGGDVDACQNPPEPGATRIVRGGAYRVRSDSPVTVYQLSPLQYEIDPPPADCPVATQCGGKDPSCKSFSADASLLLPSTAMTGNYDGLTWPSTGLRAGFFALTATADATTVKVLGKGQAAAGDGIDGDGNGTVHLDAGDVLEIVAAHKASETGFGADLSGTRIRADKPIQVIAGHSCANVPEASTGYCDHLEEALFPDETLGTDYLVTYPNAVGGVSPHVISVLSTVAGTKLHFDPAIHADVTLSPSDGPLVIGDVKKDVRISADQPILVAQLMQGSSSVPSLQGDPSLSLAVPTKQFRNAYTFIASTTYDSNFVNVIAPTGSAVTLDGKAVPGAEFEAIGSSGFSVARHLLDSSDVHTIDAPVGFGIIVYGYGKDTSYMYPGGLDLKAISAVPK